MLLSHTRCVSLRPLFDAQHTDARVVTLSREVVEERLSRFYHLLAVAL